MPQFAVETFASQLFWLSVTFTFLYVILSRVALPRIEQVIEYRKNKVIYDLEKAEKLTIDAENARKKYEKAYAIAKSEALKIVSEAYNRAEVFERQQHAAMDATIMQKGDEAEDRIKARTKEAMKQIKPAIEQISSSIIFKLSGDQADMALLQNEISAELNQRGIES